MTKFSLSQSGFLSLAGGMLVSAASAQSFTAQTLPTLGGPGAVAYGVNDAGDVVGASDMPDGSLHACVWIDGVPTDLGTLTGGDASTAFSINNDRVIVGRSTNAAAISRPVRWTRDEAGQWHIQDLGTFRTDNGGFGWATRISNTGYIVGYAAVDAGSYHAFRWLDGARTDLGTLAWTGSLAYSQGLGVNNTGQSVGFAYRTLGGPEHGFFHNGSMQVDITPAGQFSLAQGHNVTDAGTIAGYLSGPAVPDGGFQAAILPGGGAWQLIPRLTGHTDSYGYDLNESEWVVGVSFNPAPPADFRGFVYTGEAVYDLNAVTTDAPGQITEAWDISDTGLIAATADGPGGPFAVLLRPAGAPCPGDLDGSGSVNLSDLALLLSEFGSAGSDLAGDVDGDGDVDLSDLTLLLSAFGTTCP
ncbi:MAG: hypothetical protein IT450_21570 [Phycisphaerales bacterium]|nr:hypothetical protein [Phycisphaerales bacterium]